MATDVLKMRGIMKGGHSNDTVVPLLCDQLTTLSAVLKRSQYSIVGLSLVTGGIIVTKCET